MEVKSPDNDSHSVYPFKEDNTPMDEQLNFNFMASRNSEIHTGLTSQEFEVSPIMGVEACHGRSQYQLLGSEQKHLLDFHSPKQSDINNNDCGQRVFEHEYDSDRSPTSTGILGCREGDELNDLDNNKLMQSECLEDKIVLKDGDQDVHCYSAGNLKTEGSDDVQTENYSFPTSKPPSHDETDKQCYGDITVSIAKKVEHFHEVNDLVNNPNVEMKDDHHSELPILENGGSVEVGGDVQKFSESPSHDETEKQHFGNTRMSPAKEFEHYCEVNESDSYTDIEMKEDHFSEVPISGNGGSAEGVYDIQKASKSPGRPMSVSPQRGLSSKQFMQENMPSARMDDRGSPYSRNSPRHESNNLSPPIRHISSPKGEPQQDLSQKVNFPKVEQHETTPPPTENYQRVDSPRKSGRRANSPSGKSHHREESLRESHPHKYSSKSPRRRDSPSRKGRSTSRSPIRRRDSPHQRRGDRDRSRSRSPYARERHRRSPRRKHSPRHRSPPTGSHSRRSPGRRPSSSSSHRATGVGRPGRNLFIAGFSFSTTERDLERKFSRFGRVTDVRVVRNARTGDSRGFGFLSLERDEEADAAIRAVDQTEWNGRIVLVEKSKSATR